MNSDQRDSNVYASGTSFSGGEIMSRHSLGSIPSIDRSDDEIPSIESNPPPNLAHTPPPLDAALGQPNLAHTPPPPEILNSAQPVSNLAHTPPPPPSPAPRTAAEALAAASARLSPRTIEESSKEICGKAHPGSSEPCTPDPRRIPNHAGYKRSSFDATYQDSANYSTYGSSPSSLSGVYGAIGALYNSHPSSGIYSGSASITSFYGHTGPPPPVPPPPLESRTMAEFQHSRDHSINAFREFYDKSTLNQFMSPSPKLSNRDLEMNKMMSIYGGSVCSGADYAGLTEMFTDPVEEEVIGGERVVWEYHNVQLTRVPTYGFGIAVSGGRDNPHFRNGDPSVAISEVLKGGPAEGKLEVNDRLISANNISLENVDYARAVQILRDSGQSVHLVVKRRIVLPASPEPQTLKVSLNRIRKKDDFGIVLGCRIYVKEIINQTIADKDGSLMEGDVLLKINSTSTENLSLKEAKKLLDGTKDRLQLLVRRETQGAGYSPQMSPDFCTKDGRNSDFCNTRPKYSSQNLYVQPPTRGPSGDPMKNFPYQDMEAKNNLRRYPPNHLGLTSGPGMGFDGMNSPTDDPTIPPRPPLPRPEDYFTRNAHPPGHATPSNDSHSPTKENGLPPSDPRFVSFKKEGSVGIRLTGGNEVGIFVTAVQPKSQAQLQGLIPGDRILKVNDMDMNGVTREEAVLYLMSLQDQIDLIVQTKVSDYQTILTTQKGDLFYIRTHFHYEPSAKVELSFRSSDIFRVVDTLHNGVVGAWQVYRIGRNNQETQKGIIPNKARAEELATAQFNAAKKEQTQSESRSGFFKRRRNSRRSKSLGKDHWEDVVFADSVSKFPAYERVTLRHPGFVRPLVLFGPLADVARDKLMKENSDKFASPQLESSISEKPTGIIRLSAIREIMERGKHAVLDITPNAVDRLNYAQFYPIVIFLRADSKQVVKELRSGLPKGRMSSKKLYDQSVKLEKLWSHVFTSTISLSQPDMWYRKLKETLDKQQSSPIWMSEAKPSETLNDDFLFPMTSRLSYASSPESDLDTGPDCRTPSKSPHRMDPPLSSPIGSDKDSRSGRLVKSSSDPSIAAPDEGVPLSPITGVSTPQNGPPPYGSSPSRSQGPVRTESTVIDDRRKSHGGDSKYGFASSHDATDHSLGPPGSSGAKTRLLGPPLPTINGIKEENGEREASSAVPGGGPSSLSNNSQFNQPPLYHGNRNNTHQLNLPSHSLSSPHSPHHPTQAPHSPKHQPPFPHVSRSPTKNALNYPTKMVGGYPPSSPQSMYNGHHSQPNSLGDAPPLPIPASKQPELPPKINRSIKPHRLRASVPQDDPSQQEESQTMKGNEFGDSNYINTGRGGLPIGSVPSNPNSSHAAINDVSSLERQNKSPYEVGGGPFVGQNAHDDIKGRGCAHPRSPPDYHRYGVRSSQPSLYYTEDVCRSDFKPMPPPKTGTNYKPVPPPKPKQYRGGSSEAVGNATQGGWGYPENGQMHGTSGRGGGGYYLNVPPPRDNPHPHYGPPHGVNSRDLPNHDLRGSAFELYKKPTDPRNALLGVGPGPYGGPLMPQQHGGPINQLPPYLDQGSR